MIKKKENKRLFLNLKHRGILIFLLFCTVLQQKNFADKHIFNRNMLNMVYIATHKEIKTPNEAVDTMSKKEKLYYYMTKHNIIHKDIVYKQAVLETGNFTSRLCRKNNNLFGLYDSKNKRFHRFNSWEESVVAYKKYVQYKYFKKNYTSYYHFLEDIGYAEKGVYTKTLKQLNIK